MDTGHSLATEVTKATDTWDWRLVRLHHGTTVNGKALEQEVGWGGE